MTPTAEVTYIDLFDPACHADSPEVLATREACWYAHTPLGLAVLRYAECAMLLRDRRLRPGSRETLASQNVTEGPLAQWWDEILLNIEGADHCRLRRVVAGAFTARQVERLVPAMRRSAYELLDMIVDARGCEFVTAFADPYSLRVICELLAIPKRDRSAFAGWANDLGLASSLSVPQFLPQIEAAVVGLCERVDELIARRRREPGDDLVSELIAVEEAGERLSDAELRALLTGLIFAGTDTTRTQLGRAMVLFAEHPHEWALLRQRPELAANAVEEVLRLVGSVPLVTRVALEDLEVNGLHIPAGTHLTLMIAAANTDPRVFDPTGLDLTCRRPRQLTFGGGVHHCLGSWLARIELREALSILAQRMPGLRLDGESAWRPAMGIYGPTSLPLRWTPPEPEEACCR
jgi:cytochrome P450